MRTEDELGAALRDVARDVATPEAFARERLADRRFGRDRRTAALVAAVVVVLLLVVAAVTSVSLLGRGHDTAPAGPAPVPTGTDVPTSVASRPVPAGWRTEHAGITAHYPTVWVATRYTGAPATVASPLFYLSERPLARRCSGDVNVPTTKVGGTFCFNGGFHVPANGLVIRWAETELTSSPQWYRLAPGRPTTIAGRVAKLYSGPPRDCGPGASSQISAEINMSTDPYAIHHTSQDYVMTACLGPHVPTTERAAVYAMLATVHVRG